MVKEGPPLNVSSGLFQLGMTMSKFAWNRTGEIENFRDGFFEVKIKSMGLYYDESEVERQSTVIASSGQPEILSRDEAKKKKSVLFKLLGPLVRIVFFSEARYVYVKSESIFLSHFTTTSPVNGENLPCAYCESNRICLGCKRSVGDCNGDDARIREDCFERQQE